jgi:RNA-binding protein YlmH
MALYQSFDSYSSGMKTSIYTHYLPEEKPFIDKCLDSLEYVTHHRQQRQTDFLDPRQIAIITSLSKRYEQIQIHLDGGYEEAERVRVTISPFFQQYHESDEGIQLISATSDHTRVSQLGHGDYLGAVIGLGVKREKIGDLHIHPWGAHLLVAAEMASFLTTHLNQVGRVHVSTQIVPLIALQRNEQQWQLSHCIVTSLRLDGVVSEVLGLSRAKVLPPIQSGRCKVNWKVEDNPSKSLKENDVISYQGIGRFKIFSIDGLSKKGKIRLTIGKII